MILNFKKAIIPLGVMVFGALAAFASNATKQSSLVAADYTQGFRYNPSAPVGQRCVMVQNISCSDSVVDEICTASGEQVWKTNNAGLTCTGELYLKRN